MSLGDMARLLARNWILILVVALLSVANAGVDLLGRPTMYVSTSKILAVNQLRVATYAQMVQTDAVLRPAVEKVGRGSSIDELGRSVSVTTAVGSALLELSVTAASPEIAQALADVVTENLIEEIDAFEAAAGVTTDPVRLVQPAGQAVELAEGSTSSRLLMAFAGGAFLGALLAGVRFWAGMPLRREREVESLSGAPVISRLHDKDGPATQTILSINGEQLQPTMQFLSAGGRRIYGVADAVPDRVPHAAARALAEGLADVGSRVVLVDLGGWKPLGDAEVAEAQGVNDILAGRVTVDQVVQKVGESPVWTIPSGSAAPNPAELLAIPTATDLFRGLEQEFDYVIVSGSVRLISTTDSLLGGSILIVTMKDTTDRELVASAAMLRRSVPLVGVITKERTSRGPAAWLSRLSRRRMLTRWPLRP